MFTKKSITQRDKNSMTDLAGNADVKVPLSFARRSAVRGFTPVTRLIFLRGSVVLCALVSSKQQQTSKQ